MINASFENLVLTAFLYGMKGDYEQASEIVERIKGMEVTEEQKKVLDELIRRIEQVEAE